MTYPLIATTTTGRRVQLPIHPTLADRQNLTGSSKIGIHEISRVNSDVTTTVSTQTTRQLLLNPIGNNEQQHYPISEFESSNSLDDQCVTEISDQGGTSTGEITNPTYAENVVPDIENQSQSTTRSTENDSSNHSPIDTLNAPTPDIPFVDDHRMMTSSSLELSDQTGTIGVSTGEITNLAHTKNVLPDIENQIQFTTRSMENPDSDAAIPDAALLHGYPRPKTCAVFMIAYPSVVTVGTTKYKKYSPFDTPPYMIISLVAYLMALLVLVILFCLYARLSRPSTQHVFAGLYKTLTYIYGFLMILATLCVVATLFTQKG